MGSIPTRSRHSPVPGRRRSRRGRGLPELLAALAAGLVLLLPAPLGAQERGEEAERRPAASDTAAADSARGPPVSPLGAFARSVVVPGWGQVAVDRPGRGAFYFTMEALSMFMVLKTQAKLDAARKGIPGDTALVEARRGQREDWIALAVFWSLFSGVDAWVSAQFWGYEGVVRPPEDGSAGAELRVEVPLPPH